MSGWISDLWDEGIADWGLASNLVAEALGILVILVVINRLLDWRERRAWEGARAQVVQWLRARLRDWLAGLYVRFTGEKAIPNEYFNDPPRFGRLLDDAVDRPEVVGDNHYLYSALDFLVRESITRLTRFPPVLSREAELATLLQQLEGPLARWNSYFVYGRPGDTFQHEVVADCMRSVRDLVAYLWPQPPAP